MSEDNPFKTIDTEAVAATETAETAEPVGTAQTAETAEPVGTAQTAETAAQDSGENPFKSIASEEIKLSIAKTQEAVPYEEPNKVFATGLPEWNLEPPDGFVSRNLSEPEEDEE